MAKKIEPEHLELVKCSWSYRNWSEWYISQWNSRGSANVNVGALEASVGFKSVLLEKSDIMKIFKSIYDIKSGSKAINYNFNISIYFNLINDQTGTKRWRKKLVYFTCLSMNLSDEDVVLVEFNTVKEANTSSYKRTLKLFR